MSNKTLLSEAQIRQFMKLAKLEPLTPGFVHGLGESHGRGRNEGPAGYGSPGAHGRLEEEDLEAELGATEDELGAEDEFADEEGDELDAMEEPEVEVPAVDAGEKMISVSDLLTALEDALEAVTGEEVSAEMDDDMEVEDEVEADVEMDAVDDMEADTEMGMEDDMVVEGGDKKGDEPADDLDYEKNESTEATDELVEQITKRVAARILKSALAKK